MITISLCMIVKNEESVLARCLDSVKGIVDEIIIVDTGSNDRTKEIANTYTQQVFNFNWINDFSAARNFSFSKATKQYQMWLDADDVVSKEDCEKILQLKKDLDTDTDIVTFKYNTHFDKYNTPILTSTRERLFKTSNNYKWNDPIHEYIELSGKIYYANDIYIAHKKESSYTDRNLKIYENQIKEGKKLSPRGTYYFARELKDHARYIEAISYFNQFLEDKLGWVEDNIASCYNIAICEKTLNNQKKAFKSLLRSFEYNPPRAEITSEIGYYYMDLMDYEKASKWFLLSISLEKSNTLGFLLNDYWDFIPNIELAVCYYKLGDIEKAIKHNELAAKYKPDSELILYNRNFFSTLKQA